MDSILKKVRSILKHYSINNKSILIGLSGGKDSMTLLSLIIQIKNEFNLRINAAYVNHNLRDKESIEEEKFINKFMKKTGIPFYNLKVKKKLWSELKNESIEMAARRIRYNFFRKIINDNKIDYIFTAHNFNDKIETFFIQLFRGGGLETLGSIPVKNKNVIRPMLNVTRREIDEFVRINSIPYFEDSTNKKNIYKRNIIRNKLLDVFKEIHPDYEKSFYHVFNFINEEQRLISKLTKMSYKKILYYEEENKICIDKKAYSQFEKVIQKYLLKLILKKLRYPAKPSIKLFSALTGIKEKYDFNKKKFYCKDTGKYILFINLSKLNEFNTPVIVKKLPFEFKNKNYLIKIDKQANIDPKQAFSILDDDSLFPLTIRQLDEDDCLLINNNNTKKIKKILKDLKIPEPLHREAIIIETKNKKIAGFFLNNYHRVSTEFYIKNIKDENIIFKIGLC